MPEAARHPGPTIVKLGGSVLTRKQQDERLRPKVLTRLATELAAAPRPLVVLHGAGSFGHPGAIKFGLSRDPLRTDPVRRARGAAIVSAEVRRLHLAVLRQLVAAGLAPWSVPPSAIARNKAGVLGSWTSEPFAAALTAGLTPVSFGDVVLDTEWGSSILSADAIAVALTRDLRARRVLFVSDVPGILERPAAGRPKIVPLVTPELVASLSTRTSGADVTGGIRGKAETMIAIAHLGADAGLISGLSDGALARALRGQSVPGTWCPAPGP